MMEEVSDVVESGESVVHQLQEAAQTEVVTAGETKPSDGTPSKLPDGATNLPVSPLTPTAVPLPTPLPAFVSSPPVSTLNPLQSPYSPGGTTSVSAVSPTVMSPVIEHSSAREQGRVAPPAPLQTPREAVSMIEIPPDMTPPPQMTASQIQAGGGLFEWGSSIMSIMVEKTRSSVESVITTLDPGMKGIIRSGGDINIVVTSTKEAKVSAVQEAFQSVFGKATVYGQESSANTAVQPVGFTAALQGADERIQSIRRMEADNDSQTIVSIEGFIAELLPDKWFELSCLLLNDPLNHVTLETFSQPTPVPHEFIMHAQDRTLPDYPLRWSGLAMSIGQAVEELQPHVGRSDWQQVLSGVGRRDSLQAAAHVLAYMYKQRLSSFIS